MSVKLDRRAFIGTALTFGALCSVSPTQAFGVTSAEKKAEVQSVKAKLDDMLAELDSAVDEYNKAQDTYDAATAKVEECKEKIEKTQAKIDKLQERLSTRATSMYRSGSMSYLDVLLGVGSFGEFATVWDTLNSLNESDADLVSEAKVARAELEEAKQSLKDNQAEAEEALETANSYKASIQSQADNYESEYNSLSAEYKQLLQEEEEAAARAATAASAAYSPTPTSTSSGSSGGGGDDDDEGSSGGGSSAASSIPTNGDVIDYAYSRIGCPYVWGASGPDTFDCSGLTMWCYAQIGIGLPHYTESQYSCAKARMSVSAGAVGDVLYRSGHVSLKSGGDTYIHAPHSGATVCEASGIGSFSCALRF